MHLLYAFRRNAPAVQAEAFRAKDAGLSVAAQKGGFLNQGYADSKIALR
jgi:hypothetical protein